MGGSFLMAGDLRIMHHLPPINFIQQHVLGLVPPKGDCVRTAVRHCHVDDDTVTWQRAFHSGKHFFSSTWASGSEHQQDELQATRWEQIGFMNLAQRLELSTISDGRVRATLHHEETALAVVGLPLPTFLMQVHCTMDCHHDGKGYDLNVDVSLCSLPMISYSGSLRIVEDVNASLSEDEAKGLGIELI